MTTRDLHLTPCMAGLSPPEPRTGRDGATVCNRDRQGNVNARRTLTLAASYRSTGFSRSPCFSWSNGYKENAHRRSRRTDGLILLIRRKKRVAAPCSVFLAARRLGGARPWPGSHPGVEVQQGQALLPDHDHHDDPEHEGHGDRGRAEAGPNVLLRVETDQDR